MKEQLSEGIGKGMMGVSSWDAVVVARDRGVHPPPVLRRVVSPKVRGLLSTVVSASFVALVQLFPCWL